MNSSAQHCVSWWVPVGTLRKHCDLAGYNGDWPKVYRADVDRGDYHHFKRLWVKSTALSEGIGECERFSDTGLT